MPPVPAVELPSKNQITKAGKLLKSAWYGPPGSCAATPEQLEAALEVVTAFRRAHSYPMVKVRLGLRSFVRTEGAQEVIAQRLKRVPRIIRKLQRFPSGPLGNLEDIGGVRAILQDGPELERVRQRMIRQWSESFGRPERNYIEQPKDIGYRAVHFVVVRDGRSIEVQLRTRGQQQWADAIEDADARHKLNLKDGDGPDEMVEYFSVSGEVIYLREYGLRVPSQTVARFDEARRAVIAAGYYRG